MPGLGMNPFKDLDVEYIWQPYWTFINPANGAIDYKYFEQYNNKLVIINFSSEHWNSFEHWVCKQLDEAGINFLILTYDPTRHQEHPRVFYFPYWYVWIQGEARTKMASGWQDWVEKNIDKISNKNKTHLLGCLNGKPRTQRIANFLKLRKKSYWDNTCVSFYKNSGFTSTPNDLPLTDEEIAEWATVEPTLPTYPAFNGKPGDHSLNLPQLIDSYLHLTTEVTITPRVFMSEKTWKPIATAVPFVVWGNPGTLAFLKSQGVDTYDDVIDHKYYDTEEDARSRLDKLYKVIDDLILQGVDKVYNQLSDRALENQRKLFNGEFDQTSLPAIINAIDQYK
jgi:hypothetical protein